MPIYDGQLNQGGTENGRRESSRRAAFGQRRGILDRRWVGGICVCINHGWRPIVLVLLAGLTYFSGVRGEVPHIYEPANVIGRIGFYANASPRAKLMKRDTSLENLSSKTDSGSINSRTQTRPD